MAEDIDRAREEKREVFFFAQDRCKSIRNSKGELIRSITDHRVFICLFFVCLFSVFFLEKGGGRV